MNDPKASEPQPVAVVTGGSRGIGRATALALARNGYRVAITFDRAADKAQAVVGELNAITAGLAFQADVARPIDLEQVCSQVTGAWGGVQALVNNAGLIPRPNDWQHMTDAIWQQTFDVNLKGVFNATVVFAEALRRQGGYVVNVASTAGHNGFGRTVAYSAAKAGVMNLTTTFAKELAPQVTVNCVAPAHIATDMLAGVSEAVIQAVINRMPLKRMGTPEEVAGLIAFLCSTAARFITGAVVPVDGGFHLS
jgi:3-oxoacyl-[acyl-carrier protein] reductase